MTDKPCINTYFPQKAPMDWRRYANVVDEKVLYLEKYMMKNCWWCDSNFPSNIYQIFHQEVSIILSGHCGHLVVKLWTKLNDSAASYRHLPSSRSHSHTKWPHLDITCSISPSWCFQLWQSCVQCDHLSNKKWEIFTCICKIILCNNS